MSGGFSWPSSYRNPACLPSVWDVWDAALLVRAHSLSSLLLGVSLFRLSVVPVVLFLWVFAQQVLLNTALSQRECGLPASPWRPASVLCGEWPVCACDRPHILLSFACGAGGSSLGVTGFFCSVGWQITLSILCCLSHICYSTQVLFSCVREFCAWSFDIATYLLGLYEWVWRDLKLKLLL